MSQTIHPLLSGGFHRAAARVRRRLAPLWSAGLLALFVVVALSTQFLFQYDMYGNYPVREIVLGWLDYLCEQLAVGACVFALVVLTALAPLNAPRRYALIAAAIALGAAGGEYFALQQAPLPEEISTAAVLAAQTVRWLAISGVVVAFFLFRRQADEAAAQIDESELQRVQFDRQWSEAQLQSLQAQIEPHFLFNTLANVRRLYGTDPSRGRQMLRSFVAYLRSALPRMRSEHTTLREEVELARAYLDVLSVRMGPRLKWRIDVPVELLGLPFPPLALSTLTENAIKHGINPLPEGGEIVISARAQGNRLSVVVADTGAGLRGSGGKGSGLANLRARLVALYGGEARLAFEANVPRGIRAVIAVPARPPAATCRLALERV